MVVRLVASKMLAITPVETLNKAGVRERESAVDELIHMTCGSRRAEIAKT